MDDLFRPYERLVEIKILGQTFQVPEKNTVLRCFAVPKPRNHPLRTLLLESRVPVLPHSLQTAGRRSSARNVELQIPDHGGDGDCGYEPGTEGLPPFQAGTEVDGYEEVAVGV